jgi:DNA-binding transcriptional LysR family regulator
MKTNSDDLALLLAVVDSGGFSAAADMLNVQVAKVSRAVSRIESQLKVTLLNRTTRRIELTEEGKQYIGKVRDALAVLDKAEEDLMGYGEKPSGRLRVDAASPFVLHQLVPLIKEFTTLYPDIRLELTSSDGIIDLLEKRTDVAIRVGRLMDSTLHARYLGQSRLHIVASPDYLQQHGTPKTPEDLGQHQLLGFVSAPALNRWPLPNTSEITPYIAVSSGETLRQLALAGHGIACLSNFMVREDIQRQNLIPIIQNFQISQPEREEVNAVYYRHSALSRRVQTFLDFIENRLKL